MWPPSFDPYEELMAHAHNIQELIKGLNHQSTYLKELANQHEQMAKLLRDQSHRIHRLETELALLKNT